jgi:hypothetical protein
MLPLSGSRWRGTGSACQRCLTCSTVLSCHCGKRCNLAGPPGQRAFSPATTARRRRWRSPWTGTWLATVSWDGTARIWAADGTPRATLTGHKSPVTGVAIAPDGTWLATTSGDQTARIWAVDCPPAAGNGDRASDAVLPVEAATPATAEAAAPGAEKPPAPEGGKAGTPREGEAKSRAEEKAGSSGEG